MGASSKEREVGLGILVQLFSGILSYVYAASPTPALASPLLTPHFSLPYLSITVAEHNTVLVPHLVLQI